jgi:ATP-dependent Lon protease
MFPMLFDHRILSSLPMPGEERIGVVTRILIAILTRSVAPHFRSKRGTDPLKLSRLQDSLSIVRFEDEDGRVKLVSLVTRREKRWDLLIHERIFDYLSFVLSGDPTSRLGAATPEELKMLAFAELILRHAAEHVLYPERKEREIIASDAEFVLERRETDPTFYRALRNALSDEMNGLAGQSYLSLLDEAERAHPLDGVVHSILNDTAAALSDVKSFLLLEWFPCLDPELQSRVLGECYRKSLNTSYTLLQRSQNLETVFRLWGSIMKSPSNALEVLRAFKDKWGLVGLFHELDLPESDVDRKSPEELLQVLRSSVEAHLKAQAPLAEAPVTPSQPPPRRLPAEPAEKSLKDRIEEARSNPLFPARVIELIDRNKLNAVGHSGSKYTELIETLLAIPWGVIRNIEVTPREFEEGLDRSHYGLQGPKEILCDFFTNLISRYRTYSETKGSSRHRTGSAFLLIGPPGVGKTSLAISVAQNLGIPYHKLSLGGMRDEADIRGHGFTYEGSKPGAIVQGLIKMEATNGVFILDEADKTEKFAISTLLEILDPEQNHLYHDKYTQTTVDIDLSNCHFFLTGNALEGVPPVVVNRCELILLDRYSVEEKIAIAQRHLLRRVREQYEIPEERIYFHPEDEESLLRYMIRNYTHEAGVRELERMLRTLFLRLQRKEILAGKETSVRITREKVKMYLQEPTRPRHINETDEVGEMLALGVDVERGLGSIIPIQATRIGLEIGPGGSRRGYLSVLHATGNIEKVMDESRKVATTGVFSCAAALGIDPSREERPVHLHFMGGSTRKDGPSAGGAIGLALASLLSERRIRRDVAMTGEIDTRGRITAVGGLDIKIETAHNAGCKTVIIPRENLHGEGGIERFPDALKNELQILTFEEWQGKHDPFDYHRHLLQVVAVQDIAEAAQVAMIDNEELKRLETCFEGHARRTADALRSAPSGSSLNGQAFQLKDPEEWDAELLRPLPSHPLRPVALLALPGIREAMAARLGATEGGVTLFPFIPKDRRLAPVLREWLGSVRQDPTKRMRLAVSAPYYLLVKDGILCEHFSPEEGIESARCYANNYTIQGIKVKNCKAVLNRVYSLLDLLDDPMLDECPFLARINGAHVIDLSFIPEKYRLDEARAQRILNMSLAHWLGVVKDLLVP